MNVLFQINCFYVKKTGRLIDSEKKKVLIWAVCVQLVRHYSCPSLSPGWEDGGQYIWCRGRRYLVFCSFVIFSLLTDCESDVMMWQPFLLRERRRRLSLSLLWFGLALHSYRITRVNWLTTLAQFYCLHCHFDFRYLYYSSSHPGNSVKSYNPVCWACHHLLSLRRYFSFIIIALHCYHFPEQEYYYYYYSNRRSARVADKPLLVGWGICG